MLVGRFAPSPSGRMHLGNIYTALISYLKAKQTGGKWILRIEDIDTQRCKAEYTKVLLQDLEWLGLEWDGGPFYQTERTDLYKEAFQKLKKQNLLYDCYCTRADIMASSAPNSLFILVYSGRCKNLSLEEKARLASLRVPATRINMPNEESIVIDGHYGETKYNLARDFGAFIVRRSDGTFAYQLAVTVDDALMGVTEIVRGNDLLPSSHAQQYIYKKLGFNVPSFFHLPLLIDNSGRRLSKRDKDIDMEYFRAHFTAQELIGYILSLCGLLTRSDKVIPVSLHDALNIFDANNLPLNNINVEKTI